MAVSIFRAVINGRIDSFTLYDAVNAGANINDHHGEKRITILMIAIKTQNRSAIKFLIERPDLEVDAVDSDGKTALIYAAQYGSDSICFKLLQIGANINHADLAGNTPLMACGDVLIIELFLQNGANRNAKNHKGETPLMLCSDRTALLLLRYGAAVNIQNQNGYTELIRAARFGSLFRLQLLICYGANPWITDRLGKTALAYAEELGDRSKISLFQNLHNYQAGVADIPENNIDVDVFVHSVARDDYEKATFRNRLMPYYAQLRDDAQLRGAAQIIENPVQDEPMDLDIPPVRIRPVAVVKTDNIAIQCIVCMENQRSVIFNCGHLIVCEECVERIQDRCPMCNTRITTKNKVFLS